MEACVINCPRLFSYYNIHDIFLFSQLHYRASGLEKQKADKSQDDLRQEISFDSNIYFPFTSCLFFKVFQGTILMCTKSIQWERETKGRQNKYQAREWSWQSVPVSLNPRGKCMVGSFPKPHLSCVKERINVKHKVFLVVYSHYGTCQVMLIWGKKQDFFTKLSVHWA